MTQRLPIHPAANLGPLDEAVIKDLMGRMTRNGYSKAEPLLMYEDQVIDGRHRDEAAHRLGITPPTEPLELLDGQTPYEWVLERHHMRDITTLMKKIYVVEAYPEKTLKELRAVLGGKGQNGTADSLAVLRRAREKRPDLLQKVKNKKLSITKLAEHLGMEYSTGSHKTNRTITELKEAVERLTLLRKADAKIIKDLQKEVETMEDMKSTIRALTLEVEELTEDLEAAEAELEELRSSAMVTT